MALIEAPIEVMPHSSVHHQVLGSLALQAGSFCAVLRAAAKGAGAKAGDEVQQPAVEEGTLAQLEDQKPAPVLDAPPQRCVMFQGHHALWPVPTPHMSHQYVLMGMHSWCTGSPSRRRRGRQLPLQPRQALRGHQRSVPDRQRGRPWLTFSNSPHRRLRRRSRIRCPSARRMARTTCHTESLPPCPTW